LNADSKPNLQRTIIGIVLPAALVGLTILPLFLFQERLPDPLATHWGRGASRTTA